jgi:hypothetical protein
VPSDPAAFAITSKDGRRIVTFSAPSSLDFPADDAHAKEKRLQHVRDGWVLALRTLLG